MSNTAESASMTKVAVTSIGDGEYITGSDHPRVTVAIEIRSPLLASLRAIETLELQVPDQGSRDANVEKTRRLLLQHAEELVQALQLPLDLR